MFHILGDSCKLEAFCGSSDVYFKDFPDAVYWKECCPVCLSSSFIVELCKESPTIEQQMGWPPKPREISQVVWSRVCKDVEKGYTLETYNHKGGWMLVTRKFDGDRPEFFGHSYITLEESIFLKKYHPLVSGDPHSD